MKRFYDTLMLILIMLVVGGGIHFLQVQGILPNENLQGAASYGGDTLNITVRQLEQIGRITHDYLNGYLDGSEWGTALPEERMKEEMEDLSFSYFLVEETVKYFYPEGSAIDRLLAQFNEGFQLINSAFENGDFEKLKQAHDIFHTLDYEVFDHNLEDEVIIVN